MKPMTTSRPLPLQLVGVLEHLVGLAHAWRRADVHAQPRAPFLLDARQQRLGGGGRRLGHAVLSFHRVPLVEGEIQLEHVDHRLAEEPELTSLGVRLDQALDLAFRHAAFARDARHLERAPPPAR